jgi:hypothetical protein
VIRLLHAAVFIYAGSYVIIPNSSAVTLIWRRSVALIVPSWIGTSYFLPVRLSVIVSVSDMGQSFVSGSGSTGAPGTLYPPVIQRPRSVILQRSLQNGCQAGSTGFCRQYTHNASAEVPKPPNLINLVIW